VCSDEIHCWESPVRENASFLSARCFDSGRFDVSWYKMFVTAGALGETQQQSDTII
jgi:hypothetical protein